MDAKDYRIALHQIPEFGRAEFKTKEYIVSIVKDLNCEIYYPTETAVVLYFNAKKEKTICLRADMDALKIKEDTNLPFASTNGMMHACGHDGHMAMLLDFACYASDNLDKLTSNIVCLFQPSEEERAGSLDILKSNILNDLNVKEMYGFHIWPNLENNKIFSMPKGMLATSAEVNIDILGKTCHAANRDKGIDALKIATLLINDYYDICENIIERHLISFGILNAGTVRNAVAEKAHLEATMRAFDDDTFNFMKDSLQDLCEALEEEFGCKINLDIQALYPSVINNEELFNEYQSYLSLNELKEPFMQAEDFGNYTRLYKSLFMLIGCGNEKLLHTSNFDFDMEILKTGVEAYKLIATKSNNA